MKLLLKLSLPFTAVQSGRRTEHVWKTPDKIQIIGKHIMEEITLQSCAAGKNETTFKIVFAIYSCAERAKNRARMKETREDDPDYRET